MELYNTWTSWICVQVSPKLQHVAVLRSFFGLNNFPPRVWPTFSLSIHPLIGIWVVSTFRLIWKMLLYTSANKSLCGPIFYFSWVHTWEWNGWVKWELCVTMSNGQICPKQLHISSDGLWGFRCLYILSDIVYVLTFSF